MTQTPRAPAPPRRRASLLPLLLLCACRAGAPLEAEEPPPRPRRGMVVSEHPLASAVGARILEQGGNAADAAVATALALAVVLPEAGNLGGGGFALHVPPLGDPLALDFRELAPGGLREELLRDEQGRLQPERLRAGPLSVGVPGTPAGLWALHQRLGSGRLRFAQLAAPAVELAHGGFPVGVRLAALLARPDLRARLERSPGAAALFYPGGQPLAEGALLVQPELAATLTRLARDGPEGFYGGNVARALVRELAQAAVAERLSASGGWVAAEDLAAYRVAWRAPLVRWFRGRQVIGMPPPSSGGVALLQVLGILDGFPLAAQAAPVDLPPEAGDAAALAAGERLVHWWIEALRRAFAERASALGDPDHVAVPVAELLSPEWIARARVAIGDRAAPALAPELEPEGTHTTHLSVLDPEGGAVALTTTLNSSFGSGILVRGGGFLLNNELDDFSLGAGLPNQFALVGGAANAPAPRKRPLSSMAPTVVRDGRSVRLVLGSRGGPRIITAVVGVLLRVLVLDQPLELAVAAPRLHQQWSPAYTDVEPGWPETLLQALRDRGHELREREPWGAVQAIAVLPGGEVVGVSDPRSGGAAVGTRAPAAR